MKIIEEWPSTRALASDLDIDPGHCRVIKCRRRIPRAYWHDLVEAAERRGIAGVSIKRLKHLHEKRGKTNDR